MEHTEGEFAGAGGLRLYYQRWRPDGVPARAAIIMLHGDFAHSGWYDNLPLHETPRGYAVYACDRRGWGRSPGPRGYLRAWREYLDDLGAFVQLVNAEEPGRPIILMGHTGSGPIVLEYAAHHPQAVRAVFCVSPVLGASVLGSAALRRAVAVLSVVWPRFTLDVRRRVDAAAPTISSDPAFLQRFRTDPLRNTKVTMRWLAEADRAIGRTGALAATFPVPLLLLVGGADPSNAPGAKAFALRGAVSPNVALREYPGGRINLLSDSVTPAVLSDLDAWLDARA